MSASIFRDLFPLGATPAAPGPEPASGEYASLSVEELLSMVPSLETERFSVAYRVNYFGRTNEWEISWAFKGCSNELRSPNLHLALLKSFEHQIERARGAA